VAILRLTHKYGPRRVEAACDRALAVEHTGYGVVTRILQEGLDRQPVPPTAAPPQPPAPFTRPWIDFFAREA
jgi:hypothetical protein